MSYARAFITPDDMKGILKKSDFDDKDKKLLDDDIIPGVSNAIEKNLHRKILSLADLTEYYTGSGNEILQLDEYPIIAITSVHDRRGHSTYTANDYDYAVVDGTDFITHNDLGQLRYLNGSWYSSYRYYKVIYSAGYALSDLPQEIILAAKMWAAILYQKVQSQLHGVDVHVVGDESFSYDFSTIPKQVEGLIKPYRRMAGGAGKC